MPESCACDHTSIHDCVCPYCRIRFLEARVAELGRLLTRYRTETPLGNQPHMIAGEVDAILNL